MSHVSGIFYITNKRCTFKNMLFSLFRWFTIGEEFFIVVIIDPLPYISQHII